MNNHEIFSLYYHCHSWPWIRWLPWFNMNVQASGPSVSYRGIRTREKQLHPCSVKTHLEKNKTTNKQSKWLVHYIDKSGCYPVLILQGGKFSTILSPICRIMLRIVLPPLFLHSLKAGKKYVSTLTNGFIHIFWVFKNKETVGVLTILNIIPFCPTIF